MTVDLITVFFPSSPTPHYFFPAELFCLPALVCLFFILKKQCQGLGLGQPILLWEHLSYWALRILRNGKKGKYTVYQKQIYRVPYFLAPFGQVVKLETADVGIFFRGKSAFVDVLRSQILSLPESVYPWKLET